MSGGGISNEEVIKFFENEKDNDLKENFVGVFLSNYINKFISFHELAKEKNKKYPFIIMNTDRSDKAGTHWWTYILEKKFSFLIALDSLAFKSLL